MGRTKPAFVKRKFTGNRYTNKTTKTAHNLSSSSAKISGDLKDLNDSVRDNVYSESGFRILDLGILSNAINKSCACVNCKNENCLIIIEENRIGIASTLKILCSICNHNISFNSCNKVEGMYESNIRLTYGMRCLGKGREGATLLCGIMNLPPPCSRFDRVNKFILSSVEEVSKENMKKAAAESVRLREEEKEDDKDISTDLSVSVDGTWMKRGHTSFYGCSSIISIDTGKVLDIQVMSKYCHQCATRTKLHNLIEEAEWQENHKLYCLRNYTGSSGGMESAAVLKMFSRSEIQYGVRYVNYLGDGDSSSFKTVADNNPYENCTIQKWECIGHVQKRVGGRLRRLVKEKKRTPLEDGLPLGGRGRLTQKEIDSLQVYYGKAIRSNNSSVEDMKRAVWSIYFHKLSTDEKPMHNLCPTGEKTWCGYNKEKESYKHKHSLPEAVMNAIKPTFRCLADPELLKKCVHGKTQNVNESLNNMIWLRCPKISFCGSRVLSIAVCDAVLCFNEGNSGRIKVLKKMGLEPGVYTVKILQELDEKRIAKAELDISQLEKESRIQKRSRKRKQEDRDEEYSYGGH